MLTVLWRIQPIPAYAFFSWLLILPLLPLSLLATALLKHGSPLIKIFSLSSHHPHWEMPRKELGDCSALNEGHQRGDRGGVLRAQLQRGGC